MLEHYQAAITQYRQRVFTFAYYSLRNRADAEDVTQDVFIRLWHHWDAIDPGRVGAWLMRVAHNTVVDLIRRQRRRREADAGDEWDVPAPESPFAEDDHRLHQHLEQAIAGLADPYRSILILRDIQGHSYQDIEAALSLSPSQVKVYLHRARRQLRDDPRLRELAIAEDIVREPEAGARGAKTGGQHGAN